MRKHVYDLVGPIKSWFSGQFVDYHPEMTATAMTLVRLPKVDSLSKPPMATAYTIDFPSTRLD